MVQVEQIQNDYEHLSVSCTLLNEDELLNYVCTHSFPLKSFF